MTNDTIYFHADGGPRALTIVQLDDAKEVHISTCRQSSGYMVSKALTYRKHGMTLMHTSSNGGGRGDYRETIAALQVTGVTEAAVREFHERALIQVPLVRIAIDLHYAKQRSIDLALENEENDHA
ncbi:hypothetical protein QRO08_11555 [Paracidovorax citrulli]|uniref:Uncharacterized protein n=2 Tax=Paracidovorax citrulli TaxID=80869 RepID=A1TQN1_PARC0|nr:hypothetical protein [Paracidovorax citrulli]ABM33269.1 hypothetical protein Aave_2699 [Paracidovorax citrulli AAC00-1]ATG92807.1 hypothetical protein CQB05_01020 [Paracidovorax citrulli]MVT28920.1 hypothetical protein [Paracidovorax citrulli]MVT36606.1 hypothetical protein [Paracidovorax citrulli]PVY67502.1 hypothetical protein C8E08_4948 [Paracidovorax citrulli]